MTDELAYTERLDRQIDALMRRAEKADARIIELERREALLTAVMVEVDAWEGGSSEWWNLGSTDWLEPPAEMKEARRLLAEAGFPW